MTSPRKNGPSFLTKSRCQMSLLKTTSKALLLIILSGLLQNTRKDFSDLLCLCPGKMRTTRAFSGPLRRNSSDTTICFSSDLFELAVFEKKLSLMSLHVGTLVSEQGIKAASELGMEGKCDVTGLLQPSSGSRWIESTEIRVPRTRRLNLESFG